MQSAFDEKDKIIRKTVRERQPIRHFELRKIIVKDKGIMSEGTFERRVKNLIKMKALSYTLVEKMKFYSFDFSIPPEAHKVMMMKYGLQSADINITTMRKILSTLSLDEKAEFATSCILSVLANIFDVVKHNIDHNPKTIGKWRLLIEYQRKLREMYDVIHADKDHDILESFVNAKCRPNPNQLEKGEFEKYMKMCDYVSMLNKTER